MSVTEYKTRSMTEQAVDALKAFEPMVAMVLQYGDLTVEADGIGKVEEAHKALKRLRIDVDDKRSELNAPALEYQRTVNATAKELIAQITTAESKLKAQRDIHDAEKLKEKQAKEAAKAAVLNERVGRLSGAGIVVSDIAAIGAMAPDEFEFYFAKESRVVAEAKAEAERMEALRLEEHKRQAEELHIRAVEIERQRLADEAVIREERKANEERLRAEREAIEADRAEMRRQQEEIARHQAELRAKAEAEAAEQRRKEREAEQARREAAAAPELEKLEGVIQAMKDAGSVALQGCGVPQWSAAFGNQFEKFSNVMRQHVRESL